MLPFLLLVCGLSLMPVRAGTSAPEVVAVLSSDLLPYREALAGFEAGLGRPVTSLLAGDPTRGVPAGTRLVVAFGGKAAVAHYPDRTALLYCLAPAVELDPARRRAAIARVELLPRAAVVLSRLREIQPSLRRLTVIWISEVSGAYARDLQDAGRSLGVEIVLEQIGRVEELPGVLRRVARSDPGALWVPPDPLLLTPASFTVLHAFARARRLPLYVASQGLVERGALAGVTASYRGIGRSAAVAARVLLAGDRVDPVWFPEEVQVSVNLRAAAELGMRPPPEVLQRATQVFE